MKAQVCDHCQKLAPEYATFATASWFTVSANFSHSEPKDFCSAECIVAHFTPGSPVVSGVDSRASEET